MVLLELSHTHTTATATTIATTTCTVLFLLKMRGSYFIGTRSFQWDIFIFTFFYSHYNSGSYIRTVFFYLDHQSPPFRRKGIDCTLTGVVLIVLL